MTVGVTAAFFSCKDGPGVSLTGVAVGAVVWGCAVGLGGIGAIVGRFGTGVFLLYLSANGVAVTFSGKGTGVAVGMGMIFSKPGLVMGLMKVEPTAETFRQDKRTTVQSKTDRARYFFFMPSPSKYSRKSICNKVNLTHLIILDLSYL
jgi:hypothetical protein